MPRLVALCEDIYAARAEGELALEEALFWTVIRIYRDPAMLIEYTTTFVRAGDKHKTE